MGTEPVVIDTKTAVNAAVQLGAECNAAGVSFVWDCPHRMPGVEYDEDDPITSHTCDDVKWTGWLKFTDKAFATEPQSSLGLAAIRIAVMALTSGTCRCARLITIEKRDGPNAGDYCMWAIDAEQRRWRSNCNGPTISFDGIRGSHAKAAERSEQRRRQMN